MSKMGRITVGLLALIVLATAVAACGQAAAPAPTTTPPEAIAAGPASDRPPDVDNDAPAGECQDTTNILSRVDRAPNALFRAVALDNRVGGNDGDGIVGVRFTVTGDNLSFVKDELTAPYCAFGGNEPDCGVWPRDEAGRYTWGAGGSLVQPGRFHVMVEVVAGQPDSATGRAGCDWEFDMQVSMP